MMDATQVIEHTDDEDTFELNSNFQLNILLKGDLDGSEQPLAKHPLKYGENIIGRDQDCDVIIDDKALSRHHAAIFVHKDSFEIYDLGSTNKTKREKLFLKPLVHYELKANQIVRFGDVGARLVASPVDYQCDANESTKHILASDSDSDATDVDDESHLQLQNSGLIPETPHANRANMLPVVQPDSDANDESRPPSSLLLDCPIDSFDCQTDDDDDAVGGPTSLGGQSDDEATNTKHGEDADKQSDNETGDTKQGGSGEDDLVILETQDCNVDQSHCKSDDSGDIHLKVDSSSIDNTGEELIGPTQPYSAFVANDGSLAHEDNQATPQSKACGTSFVSPEMLAKDKGKTTASCDDHNRQQEAVNEESEQSNDKPTVSDDARPYQSRKGVQQSPDKEQEEMKSTQAAPDGNPSSPVESNLEDDLLAPTQPYQALQKTPNGNDSHFDSLGSTQPYNDRTNVVDAVSNFVDQLDANLAQPQCQNNQTVIPETQPYCRFVANSPINRSLADPNDSLHADMMPTQPYATNSPNGQNPSKKPASKVNDEDIADLLLASQKCPNEPDNYQPPIFATPQVSVKSRRRTRTCRKKTVHKDDDLEPTIPKRRRNTRHAVKTQADDDGQVDDSLPKSHENNGSIQVDDEAKEPHATVLADLQLASQMCPNEADNCQPPIFASPQVSVESRRRNRTCRKKTVHKDDDLEPIVPKRRRNTRHAVKTQADDDGQVDDSLPKSHENNGSIQVDDEAKEPHATVLATPQVPLKSTRRGCKDQGSSVQVRAKRKCSATLAHKTPHLDEDCQVAADLQSTLDYSSPVLKPKQSAVRKSGRKCAKQSLMDPGTDTKPKTSMKRLICTSSSSPSLSETDMSRRPTNNQCAMVVMLTGCANAPKYTKIVDSLKGQVSQSTKACSLLVTDKFRRTVKTMCCVAQGKPIVRLQWLNECKKSDCFIDPYNYIIDDKQAHKQYGFDMKRTLQLAAQKPLMKDLKVHVTENVKPPPNEMKEIISCAGAKYLNKLPKKVKDDGKTVIISCSEDLDELEDSHKPLVVSNEFLLTGLLRYDCNVAPFHLLPSS